MKELKCENCGSIHFHQDEDKTYICDFCGTKYFLMKDDNYVIDSSITLREDVSTVLRKWEQDPANGKKYAQIILQMDSSNRKALQELGKHNQTNNSSSGCYVATCVYGSYDCPEVWTLRRFRDYELAETWYGRLFIRGYYVTSPTIVKWFGNSKWFRNIWKPVLDKMVYSLKESGYKDTPYNDRFW